MAIQVQLSQKENRSRSIIKSWSISAARAGITGKGSALASLTDEEEVRVRALITSGKTGRAAGGDYSGPAKGGPAAPRSIRREDYMAPAGTLPGSRVPVLPASKAEKPPLSRKKPEEAVPVRPEPARSEPSPAVSTIDAPSVAPELVVPAPPAPAVEPPAIAAKAASVEAAPASTPDKPAPLSVAKPRTTVAPQLPLGPQRPTRSMQGPLQQLMGKRGQEGKPSDKKPGERKPVEKSGPSIHLAPMPTPSKSTLRSKPKEPTPRGKPDTFAASARCHSRQQGRHETALRAYSQTRREETARRPGGQKRTLAPGRAGGRTGRFGTFGIA